VGGVGIAVGSQDSTAALLTINVANGASVIGGTGSSTLTPRTPIRITRPRHRVFFADVADQASTLNIDAGGVVKSVSGVAGYAVCRR
jgi:sugar (pentulose or hexulose) kinase